MNILIVTIVVIVLMIAGVLAARYRAKSMRLSIKGVGVNKRSDRDWFLG